MLHTKLHRKSLAPRKAARYLEEEKMNQMIQIEAYELYDRVGWMFGGSLNELLAQEVLETKELN